MKTYPFIQPQLPYDIDALSPIVTPQTIEFHYWKHEKAYIENLNKLVENTPFQEMSIEEIIRKSNGTLFNNAAQAWNHIFYFFSFSPNGTHEPTGVLRKAIDKQFGSFDNFKKEFVNVGVKLFGSGWVWLSAECDGSLVISAKSNADNPLVENITPLLTFDVWEHAYYLDYQNRRAEALEKLWDIVDWDIIASRYPFK